MRVCLQPKHRHDILLKCICKQDYVLDAERHRKMNYTSAGKNDSHDCLDVAVASVTKLACMQCSENKTYFLVYAVALTNLLQSSLKEVVDTFHHRMSEHRYGEL